MTAAFAEGLAVFEKQPTAMRLYFLDLVEAIDLAKEEKRLANVQFVSARSVHMVKGSAPPPPPPLSGAEKSLAEAHNALLTARSEGPGLGSTFTLIMNTIAPRQRATRFFGAAAESSQRSLRILLVDDHQDTCAALERLLNRRGHLVAAMQNMRSAMEAATRNQFDLLISDIALPDGSGIELMTCLRAISGIRGIAISGFGMRMNAVHVDAGITAHDVRRRTADTWALWRKK